MRLTGLQGFNKKRSRGGAQLEPNTSKTMWVQPKSVSISIYWKNNNSLHTLQLQSAPRLWHSTLTIPPFQVCPACMNVLVCAWLSWRQEGNWVSPPVGGWGGARGIYNSWPNRICCCLVGLGHVWERIYLLLPVGGSPNPWGWGGRVVGAWGSGKRYTLEPTFYFLIIFWDDREKWSQHYV